MEKIIWYSIIVEPKSQFFPRSFFNTSLFGTGSYVNEVTLRGCGFGSTIAAHF